MGQITTRHLSLIRLHDLRFLPWSITWFDRIETAGMQYSTVGMRTDGWRSLEGCRPSLPGMPLGPVLPDRQSSRAFSPLCETDRQRCVGTF